ncbi:PH domain-containing protein [Kineococcus terrestris]|uniref:PH domain-containing protein n=1 Tax=Kineococcus terrestris TaxID=2044856 RepID=UPI0034DAE615
MEREAVLRARPSRVSTVLIVGGVAYCALVSALMLGNATWAQAALLLVGLGWVVQGLMLRRARVSVRSDALVVHSGYRRAQPVAWQDVQGLRLDRPGGQRLLRFHDASRHRPVVLPELSLEDAAVVLSAYEQHHPRDER